MAIILVRSARISRLAKTLSHRNNSSAVNAASAWLRGADAAPPPALPAAALAEFVFAGGPARFPGVVLLDVSSPEAYSRARVPGALLFVGAAEGALFKDPRAASRLLGAAEAEEVAAANGVTARSRVVVYDHGPMYLSSYVCWSLRRFGLAHAAPLDGGWPAYVEAGGRVAARSAAAASASDSDAPATGDGRFVARERSPLVADADRVLAEVAAARGGGRAAQLLDTRSPAEFAGADLRSNARGGRVPGAINVPHSLVLRADGTLRPPDELRAIFAAAGVDLARPVVSYCQLGMRGTLLLPALELAGMDGLKNFSLYDGSMREWLADPSKPVEVG
jgi:thiosulfate/3-mercaptopyruvate sulfurtransferase